MPAVALNFHFADYQTEQGEQARAWRAAVDLRFPVATGGELPCLCMIDSGAPFSVLPHSLWSGGRLAWTRWGTHLLTASGRRLARALTWQGLPCALGAIEVDLVDANIRAGPFLVVAKFVESVHSNPAMENLALLGLNFVMDNGLRLEMDAYGDAPSGHLEWPD